MNWETETGRQRLDWLLKTSGVPERYREAEYGKCRVKDLLDAWAADVDDLVEQGKGLVLFGGTGTGKSMTAALATAAAVKAGRTARWAYVPDLTDQMLRNPWTRAELNLWHMDRDILILDDLGARPLTDAEAGFLDQIVEARYRRHKSMIVTTNIRAEDFPKHDNLARMRDRWRHTCRSAVIGGKSMRTYA